MKHTHSISFLIIFALAGITSQSMAQSPLEQQSTSGPVPPASVLDKEVMKMSPLEKEGTSKTIEGVPPYAWWRGCGPTALGMVLGFYDGRGFPDLFDGEAGTQTYSVNQGIASWGSGVRGEGAQLHYEDYSLPMDDGEPAVLPDSSETYPDGCHSDDSIADFMHTSWSADNNFYGWSWSSKVTPALTSYVTLRNPDYVPSVTQYWMGNGTLTWAIVKQEIDNDRPMIFLVDTEGDGSTDHFVTIVGYSDGPPRQYGCLDTWHPVGLVRWCDFSKIATGGPWGIFAGWSFALEGAVEGEGEVCVENPEQCAKPQGGHFVEGDELCLCVPCPASPLSMYSWAKDGTPLHSGGRIFGADERTLQILLLETSDSGLYSCTYDDGSKATQVFEAEVTVAEKVPLTNMVTLVVLLAVFGSLGVYTHRKRAQMVTQNCINHEEKWDCSRGPL